MTETPLRRLSRELIRRLRQRDLAIGSALFVALCVMLWLQGVGDGIPSLLPWVAVAFLIRMLWPERKRIKVSWERSREYSKPKRRNDGGEDQPPQLAISTTAVMGKAYVIVSPSEDAAYPWFVTICRLPWRGRADRLLTEEDLIFYEREWGLRYLREGEYLKAVIAKYF